MKLDIDQVANECVKAIRDKIQNLTTLNIIVAGKTGVGKSTLINSMFREELAETGMGRPVTTHMRKISKKDFPLAVYDTRGFELGKDVQHEVRQEVMDTIRAGMARGDINEAIHCIWYCINSASNRVEPEEITWLRELGNESEMSRVPIIVVLTQSFSKKNAQLMRKAIMDENLNVVSVIPVLAQDYEIDEDYVAKAYGLDKLIGVMSEALPDELIDTLQNVQIVSLNDKIKRAQAAVATATIAAAGVCASPIPFSDCVLLIPTQVSMIASIAVIFGIDINKTLIASFVSTVLGTGGATLLGKTVVSNILKLIPGAGSVVGGAISAGTAGVITTALGETFVLIMAQLYKGEINVGYLETRQGKRHMRDLFKRELTSANPL